MTDLTESIQPRSDQINADDLIAGPITYTVREVVMGAAEPPFDFRLVETDRAYRPSKTMRRVIVNAWGAESAKYAGRRLTLYREPSIKFGGQEVGGIRISHMSHINGPVELMAQTTRGKREKFTVYPIDVAPATPTAESPPLPTPGQTATDEQPPAGVVADDGGGLFIDTDLHARAFLAMLDAEQLGVMKRMLGISGKTTRRVMADALLDAYKDWDSQDVLGQLSGWA